jgi:cytochrome c peroxidase
MNQQSGPRPARLQQKETTAMHKWSRNSSTAIAAAVMFYVAVAAMSVVNAQQIPGGTRPTVPLTSLKSLAVTEPPNLDDFVMNRQAAIALGKALFWDQQVGSDGIACASCHFHAGADSRIKNQLDPDLRNVNPAGGGTFTPMASTNKGGPNYTLTASDFPFHQLLDKNDRESIVLYDTNAVVSSSGVFNSRFNGIVAGTESDTTQGDAIFNVAGVQTRRVEPRNTPTVINAALNFRNFWDGRANDVFNGVNPFGPRDQSAHIWIDQWFVDANGISLERAVPAIMRMPFASAASQACGPPLSDFEMSGSARAFKDLGRKMTWTKPLMNQEVAADDSVLGPYRDPSGKGLATDYETLIQQAFWPEFWATPDWIFYDSSHDGYRQIEANFSMFWGIAIQMYEATLISDNTRFDQFADGNLGALTAQERIGLGVFVGKGHCVDCHKGAEFTGASARIVVGTTPTDRIADGPIERMLMNDMREAIYDSSFYNIGVTPAANDVGVGGTDPFGFPLSYARQLKMALNGQESPDRFFFGLDPCTFQAFDGCSVILNGNIREAVDGSFKVPSLRNIELTGPYFHNGGYATLESVVEFYNRGGNTRQGPGGDTSGLGPNPSNLDINILPLQLSDAEKVGLVAFLKALTDERVRWEQAPFDHPSLIVPNGHAGDNNAVTPGALGYAVDELLMIPAVGQGGLGALGLPPLQPFTPVQQ